MLLEYKVTIIKGSLKRCFDSVDFFDYILNDLENRLVCQFVEIGLKFQF